MESLGYAIVEVNFVGGEITERKINIKGLKRAKAQELVGRLAYDWEEERYVHCWFECDNDIIGCWVAMGGKKITAYYIGVGDNIDSLCISRITNDELEVARMMSMGEGYSLKKEDYGLKEVRALCEVLKSKSKAVLERYLKSVDDIEEGDIVTDFKNRTIKVEGRILSSNILCGWHYQGTVLNKDGSVSENQENNAMPQVTINYLNGEPYKFCLDRKVIENLQHIQEISV